MPRRGKKYLEAVKKIERETKYTLAEGVDLVCESKCATFDETIDLAVRLGVDPRRADQMVRGMVALPNGTGKDVSVLVFAKGEKEKEAADAGADYVGGDDLVEKIKGGWLQFDKTVATPDMMGVVGKIGKILGPRGLMPNPKVGTVTFDVGRVVKELKAGKVEFKTDKVGNVHLPVGRVSFGSQKLAENILAAMEVVIKAKPSSSKGVYLKNVAISTTMGPGIKIDPVDIRNTLK